MEVHSWWVVIVIVNVDVDVDDDDDNLMAMAFDDIKIIISRFITSIQCGGCCHAHTRNIYTYLF